MNTHRRQVLIRYNRLLTYSFNKFLSENQGLIEKLEDPDAKDWDNQAKIAFLKKLRLLLHRIEPLADCVPCP